MISFHFYRHGTKNGLKTTRDQILMTVMSFFGCLGVILKTRVMILKNIENGIKNNENFFDCSDAKIRIVINI